MPTYFLDHTHTHAFEQAAELITLVALPADSPDEQKRGNLHSALCNVALREMYLGSDAEYAPQGMRPVYVFRELPEVMRHMTRLQRLLRCRMAAGHMAIPFAQEVKLGHLPPLPKRIKRLSVNSMANEVLELASQNDPQNVRKRVWDTSQSVLHLCVALRVASADFWKTRGQGMSCIDLMLEPALLRYVVDLGEEVADLLLRSSRLPIDADRLIRVRFQS